MSISQERSSLIPDILNSEWGRCGVPGLNGDGDMNNDDDYV